jgi:hypothetical protein
MKRTLTLAILCFLLGVVEIIYKNGAWGLLLIALAGVFLVAGETK